MLIIDCQLEKSKRIIGKTVFFGLSKVLSAAGLNVFGAKAFLDYVNATRAWLIPMGVLAAYTNAVTTSLTRIPAIYNTFANKPNNQLQQASTIPLTAKQKKAVKFLVGLSYITGGFNALNAYLGAVTFAELFNGSLAEQDYAEYSALNWFQFCLIQAFGLYVFAGAARSYYSYSTPETERNAEQVVRFINHPRGPWNKEMAATIAICLFGTVSQTAYMYYSIQHAVLELPFVKLFSRYKEATHYLAKGLGVLAGVCSLPSYIFSAGAEVYKYFKHEEYLSLNAAQRKLVKLLLTTTIVSGALDIGFAGLGYFTSTAIMIRDFSQNKLSEKARSTIVLASLCGASSAFQYYIFYVRKGIKNILQLDKNNVPTERTALLSVTPGENEGKNTKDAQITINETPQIESTSNNRSFLFDAYRRRGGFFVRMIPEAVQKVFSNCTRLSCC